MIVLQGAARPNGPAAALFRLVEAGHIELCVSDEILSELRDVLSRPELVARFSSLTGDLASAFIDNLRHHAIFVADVPNRFVLQRDAKDEKYLNLAIATRADHLVSRDRDLLDLMRPDNSLHESLRSMAPQLTIVDPVALVRSLRSAE